MIRLAIVTSALQRMTVCEANELYGETGRFRYLQFADDAVQGAIDLRRPERIVLEYPRALIHLIDRNAPDFRRLFMIGHGIGTIAAHYPDQEVTVAEIDEQVVELSRTYFHYRRDNVLIGDGRQLLAEQADGGHDCLVLDAFTEEGTPHHLSTLEFFRLARGKLRDPALMLLNLMGKGAGDKRVRAIHTALAEVFPHTLAFALPGEASSEQRNMLLAGSAYPLAYDPRAMAGFACIALDPGFAPRDRKPSAADTF
ncbi:spermidine synthase [Paenibacillus sp. GCM10023250]|uniref:spermidine synthase n=1 Tax=Paenibacillus sp. GCM10023250 TaxID=3252648 RepID=UPI0036110861